MARQLVSKLLYPSGSLMNEQVLCKSHRLLLGYDLIKSQCDGTYTLMPFILRAYEKLRHLICNAMLDVGAQKLAMPSLSTIELWKKTGRHNHDYLFRFSDRHKRALLLAPTHEENITELVGVIAKVMSSRKLPLLLYQVSTKFRDEIRSSHGLFRMREFEMKDLYSFDSTIDEACLTYARMCDTYEKLFNALQLGAFKVNASVGDIGGVSSHEFHLPLDVGSDTIAVCPNCGHGFNQEIVAPDGSKQTGCAVCKSDRLSVISSIELGHCFLLGTKYSSAFNCVVRNSSQKSVLCQMGCYGIGVHRLLQACVEKHSTNRWLRWPAAIVPYSIVIIPQKSGYKSAQIFNVAETVYDRLHSDGSLQLRSEILLDDRIELSIGQRVCEQQAVGIPYIIVVGNAALDQPAKFELLTPSDIRKNDALDSKHFSVGGSLLELSTLMEVLKHRNNFSSFASATST